MASQSTADIWMGAATSDISMPSNPVLNLEDESSWKTVATSSQNTANMDVVKDNVGASRVLEEDWYTTEASLMDLSYSSPYGNLGDPRSSFGSLLDSSPLTFDTSGNVNNVVSFHHSPTAAPRTSSMGVHLDSTSNQRQLTLEDLAACNGQGSSVGLLSSISPGGQLGRSNNLMDSSFSSGLPTPASTFNRATFPGQRVTSFTDTYNTYNKKDSSQLVSYKRDQSYPNQPTLFQKRAASRGRGGTISPGSKSPPQVVTSADNSSADQKGSDEMGLDGDDYDVKDDEDLDESGDGSGGPYEVEEGAGNGGGGGVGKGNGKGKRGLPAKNLMAERRRRKKLNDRLYMLRSVVPKITKMDRASILGDAIEYLKELLQRINDIHKELEAAKADQQSRSMPSSPTPRSCYAATVKEECPVLPNPESQTPRVEVRKREGQALNIHMFCARRPGLLLSTVRALDALGLDVQQAVISCFNGFALDLFRAEAKNMEVGPDEIKAVLLLTAGCGMHQLQ